MSNDGLTKKQLRMLAIIWIGLTIVIGIGFFFGILALNDRKTEVVEQNPPPINSEAAAEPTPDVAVTDSTELNPTLSPVADRSFGYGIQAQIHADPPGTLTIVEQLGMGWVKQQIRWSDLEPVEGQPNWDALDQIFAETSARGIKVLVSVVSAPDWARTVTGDGLEGPPVDPQRFATYLSQMVTRYKGAIHAVEIWNEQNLKREWYTGRPLSAAEYVALLAPAAQAVRAADPGVLIISGALTPTGVDDGDLAINDFRYLQEMIDAGMLTHVDCVGAHHNGINLPPGQTAEEAFAQGAPIGAVFVGPFDNGNPLNPHPSWSFYSTLTGYHDIIVRAGSDKPLCVTEFGWSSVEGLDGDPREGFEFAYDNTLEEQAQNIVDAFTLMHDWGFVRLAILFNLDFASKSGGNTQDDSTLFSILDGQGIPRPAFYAVRDMEKPS